MRRSRELAASPVTLYFVALLTVLLHLAFAGTRGRQVATAGDRCSARAITQKE